MDTKYYNIYYSTSANGPWTLANGSPIEHDDDGNSYLLSGLNQGTRYYVLVVGGVMDGSDFLPLIPQPIGPLAIGAQGVGEALVSPIQIANTLPRHVVTESLAHEFEVSSIV